MKSSKSVIFYYQNPDGIFRAFDTGSDKFVDYKTLPDTDTRNRFYMFKGYEPNDEGLKKFKNDMLDWNDELIENDILSINYLKYYSHHSAVELTFKRLCKTKYEDHEPITLTESKWFEKCFNSGLMYCKPGTYKSYGYDFSLFYPSNLSDEEFLIPKKQGKEVLLKKLAPWEKLQVGFYHVKITCDNESFRKIFSFSKHDVYTHLSLKWALQNQTKFDVEIELVQDGQPNSLLYEKRDCVTGESIFGWWYKKIIKLRKLYPKNKLVKHLGSSLWGHLCKAKTLHVTLEEIEKEKMDVGIDETAEFELIRHVINSESEYYVVRPTKSPYQYNIRIKPFLVSFGRNKIAEVALQDLENVIRVHTDGIVFSKPQKLDFDNLIEEDKTTGKIEWINCNKYKKDNQICIKQDEFELFDK
jgi:hypothetical protein